MEAPVKSYTFYVLGLPVPAIPAGLPIRTRKPPAKNKKRKTPTLTVEVPVKVATTVMKIGYQDQR